MAEPKTYPRIPDNNKYKINVKMSWYRKYSETLVGEELLNALTLHDLQDIFDTYINSALYNCWQVRTRHARALQRITQHHISINNFSYFVVQEIDYSHLVTG